MLGPKEVEAGLAIDHLKVAYRKSHLKDSPAGGETAVAVLDLEGVIDAHTFKKFDHYLTAAIDNKGPMLILNCEKLDYVSSAGIGVLAGATKRCRDQQGDLRLCGVNDKVKKIINLVGLQSMLRMYEGERGALMSFKFM
jgi:anti-anti-sigma factor